MSIPTVKVEIDFSNGPSFSYPLILDSASYGILGAGILADAPLDLVDVTDQVIKVSTRRGRNRLLAQFEAGTATVVLNDPNSNFNPQNDLGPYYGKLLPLRKIRILAVTEYLGDTIELPIFAGYITSYDTNFTLGVDSTSTVTLQCVDGFRLLNNVGTGNDSVPGTFAGQYSGFRINSLLNFAGFPDSMSILDGGETAIQADPGGNRTILQAIQTVEQSELGGFFMSKSGKAVFLSRDTIAKRADSVPIKYSDTNSPPPDVYPYTLIDFAYDDQLILNRVTVQATGGAAYTEEDATSIATYFIKSGQRLDLLMQDTTQAKDQALSILAARKDADLRIDSLTLNLYASVDEVNTVANLSMDIYTLINATKSMPGGSSITKELFVQGVQHDIAPNSWNMKLYTAEPLIQAFILDSNSQGKLAIADPPLNNTLSY